MKPSAQHHFADELIISLRQATLPDQGEPRHDLDALLGLLETISTNAEADPVLRDYAIQHLAGIDENLVSQGLAADHPARARIRQQIASQAQADSPASATALLHLGRQGTDPAVRETAQTTAFDPQADPARRSASIHTLAEFNHKASAPKLAQLAGNKAEDASLRMSAIHVLGRLAFKEQRPFLSQLALNDPDKRIRNAARAVLTQRREP